MFVVIEGYEAKKRSGAISIAVSEELIVGAAMQQAYFAQAQSMVNGNLNPHQVQEFNQLTHCLLPIIVRGKNKLLIFLLLMED
jgi:hypothetical protein